MTVRWLNGPTVYAGGLNRFGVIDPRMIGATAGYYGDPALSNPVVDELYTAHLVVSAGYPPRAAVRHRARVSLPPNTVLDLESGVRCYRQRPDAAIKVVVTRDSDAVCVQNPTQGADRTWDFGERDLIQGNRFEIEFDVRTSAPVTNGLLTGFVDSEYGTGPLSTTVAVNVFPAPPPANFNGTWFGTATSTSGSFPPGRSAPFRLEIQHGGTTATMAEYDDWAGGGFSAVPLNQGSGAVKGRQVVISTVQPYQGTEVFNHTWTLSVNNSNTSLHLELYSENPPSFPFSLSTVSGDLRRV